MSELVRKIHESNSCLCAAQTKHRTFLLDLMKYIILDHETSDVSSFATWPWTVSAVQCE